jgi:hypothetical protein
MLARHLLLIFGLMCYGASLTAQEERALRAISNYSAHFSHQIYQGKLYGNYPPNVTGHQSYRELGVVDGSSIVFDDVRYHDVPLMFDLVRKQLVTRHPVHLINLILPIEQVSSFTIGDDAFVYLDQPGRNLPAGFYQRIAESADVSCFAKWTKEYREITRGTRLLREFSGEVAYFLMRNGQDTEYKVIRSQEALLRSFKEHRRPLRRALFDLGLSFKEDPEATLAFVLDYVDDH